MTRRAKLLCGGDWRASATDVASLEQRVAGKVRSIYDSSPEPVLAVSSSSSRPRYLESGELTQRVNSLEAEKLQLQMLVCDLLHENEQLRHEKQE